MKATLDIAKALADGNRMRVVAALMEREELCVCQIVEILGLATATVSRHMRILENARLVVGRKDGRWVYYRLAQPLPAALRQWLTESLWNAPEVQADRALLDRILVRKPEELCRRQKTRRESPA
jgi:ArsR family transcriptional regulator